MELEAKLEALRDRGMGIWRAVFTQDTPLCTPRVSPQGDITQCCEMP